jgi:hypothetical protein
MESGPAQAHDQQTQRLLQALRQTRYNLILSALLLLGFGVAGGYLFYFTRYEAPRRKAQLAEAIKQRLKQEMGSLVEEAGGVTEGVLGPVTQALLDQLDKELPALVRAAEQEGEALADRLEAVLVKALEERYRAEYPRYRAVLREEFPGAADDAALDRMMSHLDAALKRLIRRYHAKALRDRVQEFQRLWRSIPPADEQGGVQATSEGLGADLVLWARLTLVDRDK